MNDVFWTGPIPKSIQSPIPYPRESLPQHTRICLPAPPVLSNMFFLATSRVSDAKLASIRFGDMLEPATRSESVVLPDYPTSFFSAKSNISQGLSTQALLLRIGSQIVDPTVQRCMMRQIVGAPPVAIGSQVKAYEKAMEELLIKGTVASPLSFLL